VLGVRYPHAYAPFFFFSICQPTAASATHTTRYVLRVSTHHTGATTKRSGGTKKKKKERHRYIIKKIESFESFFFFCLVTFLFAFYVHAKKSDWTHTVCRFLIFIRLLRGRRNIRLPKYAVMIYPTTTKSISDIPTFLCFLDYHFTR